MSPLHEYIMYIEIILKKSCSRLETVGRLFGVQEGGARAVKWFVSWWRLWIWAYAKENQDTKEVHR